jgi:hypothetical protein
MCVIVNFPYAGPSGSNERDSLALGVQCAKIYIALRSTEMRVAPLTGHHKT